MKRHLYGYIRHSAHLPPLSPFISFTLHLDSHFVVISPLISFSHSHYSSHVSMSPCTALLRSSDDKQGKQPKEPKTGNDSGQGGQDNDDVVVALVRERLTAQKVPALAPLSGRVFMFMYLLFWFGLQWGACLFACSCIFVFSCSFSLTREGGGGRRSARSLHDGH